MDNVYTKGSEYAHQPGPPVNEDWSMVCKVLEVDDETGIMQCYKIWDEDEDSGKVIYALVKYCGQPGRPHGQLVEDQEVVVHRVGTGNSADGTDFVCFIGNELHFVKDLGDGTGQEVVYSGGSFSAVAGTVHTMYTADPTLFFHNGGPPWAADRIYLGVYADPNWIVVLPGFGDEEHTMTATAAGYTWTLSMDNSGKITDFSVEAAE